MLGSTGNGFVRNSLLRRGSVQGHKPAPPVRRTSSISVSGGTVTYSRIQALGQSSQGSLDSQSSETLPPPPPFLLDSQTSSSIANKAARFNHTSGAVTSSSESRATISEYQRTAAMGIAAEIQRKTAAQVIFFFFYSIRRILDCLRIEIRPSSHYPIINLLLFFFSLH